MKRTFLPPAKEIARLCGVDLSTARRWRRGHSAPPKTALLVLAGDLGLFSRKWAGWVIRNDTLVSPEGFESTPGDVRAQPFQRQQIAVYQADNRRLRKLEGPQEDQPNTTEWELCEIA